MHFPNIAAIGCHLLPLIQGARRASASSQCSETPSVSMDWLQGNMGNSVGNSLGNSVETIGLSHQLGFLVEFLFEHFWYVRNRRIWTKTCGCVRKFTATYCHQSKPRIWGVSRLCHSVPNRHSGSPPHPPASPTSRSCVHLGVNEEMVGMACVLYVLVQAYHPLGLSKTAGYPQF